MMTPGAKPASRRQAARKRLRVGFSTGTAAAAAAKAALSLILEDRPPRSVEVELPSGLPLSIPVHGAGRLSGQSAWASVIKDAGDDPDVTNGAEIRARVAILPGSAGEPEVIFLGGPGVGRVTRPGLPVEVGEPAINPVPRRMISQALRQVWRAQMPVPDNVQLEVEISVPRGEAMARRTFNPRLGILGGISILGTHGLVKPFSHQGYTGTIDSALSVARAQGLSEVVLTTGGKSEKLAQGLRPDLPQQAFIQIADFFAHAITQAVKDDMRTLGLACFFGKAVKQAMGLEYTHAHKAPLDHQRLARWFQEAGAGPELAAGVRGANTARHVLEMLTTAGRLDLVPTVGTRVLASARKFAGPGPALWAVILDFDGRVLFQGRGEARS